MHPDFYEGPPMVKPPVVHLVSMLRALGRYIDTDAWTWICYPTGQFLFHPPNVAGWDDTRWLDTSRMRARWNMVHYALRKTSVNAWNSTYSTTETAEEALARAQGHLGRDLAVARARCRAARLRPHRAVASDRQLAAVALPGPAPERPPTADRRLRRCDAGMSRGGHNHCGDYTRSQLFRTAAAQAGAGLPAIEPGAPDPAGTGLTRRSFISRSAGPGALGLRRLEAAARRLRGGHRSRATPPTGSSSRSSSTAASTPSACSRRSATRGTRRCGPTLALPAGAGTAFSEDPRMRWHPAAAALATLHAEGKVSTFPAIGYTDPNQSHFTSRHYYEIGEVSIGHRTGWLGRYIDSVGDDENPMQGLSMDGSLSPMLATADRPVAAIDSVDGYDLWSSVGDPIEQDMYDTLRADRRDAVRHAGARPGPPRHRADREAAPGPRRRRRVHEPGRLSRTPTSPTSSRASPRSSSSGCRSGSPRSAPPAATTPTPRRPATSSATCARRARRCSPSSATSRHADLADRVLTEVWSEFGRRPEENGSRGTDHGAAGLAFVVGSRAQGQMVGEFPGLATLDPRGQPSRHERLPVDVLLAARAVARPRRRRDHPGRIGLRPPRPGQAMRGAAAAAAALCLGVAAIWLTAGAGARRRRSRSAPSRRARRTASGASTRKRVVRWVRRDGRRRRVVRVRRWWRCHPIASPTRPGARRRRRSIPIPVCPGRLGVRADEFSYTLSRPTRRGGRRDHRARQPRRGPAQPQPRADRHRGPAADDRGDRPADAGDRALHAAPGDLPALVQPAPPRGVGHDAPT